ncbi:hypothetical protein, conserved [Eimeria praecox]|uniref:Fungal lipase-type domain-containing protein n=1 Tax=Eimeria praecox TaxID=51316 RepID=U6GRX4_9EIME|nr:hypothetical protein, conserved [Eimeria praecox]
MLPTEARKMVWTFGFPSSLRFVFVLLIINAAGVIGMGLFEEELKSYPIVGIPAADATRSVVGPLHSDTAPRGALYNEERVHIRPDGTIVFDCPRSVCGTDFYFGRVSREEEGHQSYKKVVDKNDTSRASYMRGADPSMATAPAERRSQTPTGEPLLKDLVHTTDMSWLGTDEKLHQLAFTKNSACVKVCETVQTYPERLLQGFPGHVHPDHPSYVQLPIYSYFRKAGAEVAFPKDAPTIFQPRIYDGNIPVDRKSSSSKFDFFALAAELIFGSKGEAQRRVYESGSTDPGVDSGTPQKSNISKEGSDLQKEELQDEKPQLPENQDDSASGRTTGGATEEWKREMYRAWHCLWILNLVAYEASDIWNWVQNHKARTFIFPPWKVIDVGVLRTAESVPMRWRDLSPRFHVDPNMESSSEQPSQPELTPGNDGVHTESGVAMGTSKNGENISHQGNLEEGVGPSFSSRAHEQDAAVADRHPKASSRLNSADSGEAAKPHSDSLREKFSTVLSTARFKGQREASKPHKTIDADVSNREEVGEKQDADVLAGRPSGIEDGTSSQNEVPEGCISYLTDMSLFKKFGWPGGRLVSAGPSGNRTLDETVSTTDEWVDGSWRPKIIGSNVKCLPVVHPDTCGLTASFSRVHESPWVWRLERDESAMPSKRADNLDYADTVWIFRGTFVSKQWLLNGMGVAVPYRTLSKRGRFHYGLTYLFDKAVRPLMEKYLESLEHQIRGRKTPLVVVFSGHSLGAAIAEMSSWYFAKRAKTLVDKNLLQIRTVAFGSPSWGDKMAYEDLLASGVIAQEINMDIDPVAVLFGEEDLTKLSHRKPFMMKREDLDKTYLQADSDLAAFGCNVLRSGEGRHAPLADAVSHLVGHPRNAALRKAHEQLSSVLRRVDADRAAEEGS